MWCWWLSPPSLGLSWRPGAGAPARASEVPKEPEVKALEPPEPADEKPDEPDDEDLDEEPDEEPDERPDEEPDERPEEPEAEKKEAQELNWKEPERLEMEEMEMEEREHDEKEGEEEIVQFDCDGAAFLFSAGLAFQDPAAMTSAVSPADLKSLPNLPGYTFPEYKDNYARPNTWRPCCPGVSQQVPAFDALRRNVVNGVRIEQKEGLSFDKPKFVKVSKAPDVWRSGSLPDSQTRAVFKNAGADIQFQDLPAWDAFDRHVLRFSGYFKDPPQ
eukprot:s477_g20.t1